MVMVKSMRVLHVPGLALGLERDQAGCSPQIATTELCVAQMACPLSTEVWTDIGPVPYGVAMGTERDICDCLLCHKYCNSRPMPKYLLDKAKCPMSTSSCQALIAHGCSCQSSLGITSNNSNYSCLLFYVVISCRISPSAQVMQKKIQSYICKV